MSDRIFIFDIETVRNALPWEPPASYPDKLAPAPCWDIVCIGGLLLDLDPAGVKASLRIVSGAGPAEWVARVNLLAERATLVSFNGRGFDAPVIEATALRLNVPIPALMSKRFRGRYDAGHQDREMVHRCAVAPPCRALAALSVLRLGTDVKVIIMPPRIIILCR